MPKIDKTRNSLFDLDAPDPLTAEDMHHHRRALWATAVGPMLARTPLPDILASVKTPDTLTLTAAGAVSFAAESLEAGKGGEKRPTFSINAYTGGPMSVSGFITPVVVDLGGMKANRDKIPILLDHDPSKIIGQTDAITITGDNVSLSGTITGDDANAQSVIGHAKNGFEWGASIGASVVRSEFLKSGEKTQVNGREVSGPLMIARESRLFETSFVAIGADSQASANVAASQPTGTRNGEATMFDKWLQAKGFDPAALDEKMTASLQAMYDAEQAKAKDDAKVKAEATQTLDQIVAAQRAEDTRVAEITRLAGAAIRDRPALLDTFERLAKSAIEAKSSVGEFELAILRIRAESSAPGAFIRSGDTRAGVKVIEAALCLAGGIDHPEKHYDERTLDAAHEQFAHGLGLRDVLTIAARENGYTGRTSGDVRALLQAAFAGSPGSAIRADGFSTLSLPGTLGNVANKFLAAGFTAVEDGWRDISSKRNARDFKTMTSYSLTGDMTYEKVGPGGELKHAGVGELSYTNKVETYGRLFAVTRQDIINDDLGALTAIPQKIGRGAALKLNNIFWTAFLAGVGSTWASGNANLLTGGTSVLSSAALALVLAKFRKQTDPDGQPLGISPAILLVPPELEITADELMTATAFNTGGSSTTDRVPNRNTWAGKYKVVQSSYLSNTSITGNSTTAWWLLADPMDLSTIEVAFLNGRDTPVVESADADFNTLGIQFRGYMDAGVAIQEYRASVRSAGA